MGSQLDKLENVKLTEDNMDNKWIFFITNSLYHMQWITITKYKIDVFHQ